MSPTPPGRAAPASTVALHTARLRLRQWSAQDLQPFAALNADTAVMAFFPQCLDARGSDALAARLRAEIDARGWGLWAVERREPGDFIGFVGLNPVSERLAIGPAVEVAWRLARHTWGRGYATEGARAALAYAFDRLSLSEVVAFTVPDNQPSRGVMRRLGMRADPDHFEHPDLPAGHPLRRHCVYRIARTDWLSAAASGC